MNLQPDSALQAPFRGTLPVTGFNSARAVLLERADIGCVLLTAAVDGAAVIVAGSAAAGVDLPSVAGLITRADGRTAMWLSPKSWLIRCDVEEERGLVGRIRKAFPDHLCHATVFTDALCWFELSGPGSLELLTEGSPISLERNGLPVGGAKRTLVAQVAAIVVRERENGWLIAVERSRSRYFANWLSAAAASRE